MSRSPQRTLDEAAFLGALGAVGLLALWFAYRGYGTAIVMCGLCLAGLAGGWLAGVPGRFLLPVGIGLAAVLYVAWVHPPGGPLRTSFMAHVAGGALVGWAMAATLRSRLEWPLWGAAALFVVAGLVCAWELAEYLGDHLLDTSLAPNRRDSTFDIFWGLVAGAAAIGLVRALDSRRRERTG